MVDVDNWVSLANGLNDMFPRGSSTSLESSLSRVRGPSARFRLRKASLSGRMTGRDESVGGTSANLSSKQHPPPQQTFSISFVSASPEPRRSLRTSSGPWDINTVDARLVGVASTGSSDIFCSWNWSDNSSVAGSVAGVLGAVVSEEEAYSYDDDGSSLDCPRVSEYGTDNLGRLVGSCGIGSRGWHVSDSTKHV